ncbi:hypothetical protein AB6C57_19675 [Vibrio splendidus]
MPNLSVKNLCLKVMMLLYLTSVMNLKNPLVFGSGNLVYINYFLVLFNLTLYPTIILWKSSLKIDTKMVFVLVSFILLLPSVIFSESPDVSGMKFISFSLTFLSIYFMFLNVNGLCAERRAIIEKGIMNCNRLLLVISFFIFVVGLGYTVNDTGFSGVLNHPQAFGILLILFLLNELLFIEYRSHSHWSYLFIVVILFLAYLTESRLSFFTCLILVISYATCKVRFTIKSTILYISFFFVAMIFVSDALEILFSVLSKSGRSTAEGLSVFVNSRGFLFEASIQNFLDNKLTGIGFQISNGKYGSYEMIVQRIDFLNLPISASIEKGVFWSALFEETGILGFLAFVFLLASILVNTPFLFKLMVTLCITLIGMGEAFYFSVRGIGLFFWLYLFMLNSIYSNSRARS